MNKDHDTFKISSPSISISQQTKLRKVQETRKALQ